VATVKLLAMSSYHESQLTAPHHLLIYMSDIYRQSYNMLTYIKKHHDLSVYHIVGFLHIRIYIS